jgi:hypothetical protein
MGQDISPDQKQPPDSETMKGLSLAAASKAIRRGNSIAGRLSMGRAGACWKSAWARG